MSAPVSIKNVVAVFLSLIDKRFTLASAGGDVLATVLIHFSFGPLKCLHGARQFRLSLPYFR